MICKETWPRWKGDARSGTQKILNVHNINPEEYRMGKTKVFIRNPTTLFYFEDQRAERMPHIVTMMQAAWRGYLCRAKWTQRKAAIRIQLFYRKYKFRSYFQALFRIFGNVKNDPLWGKHLEWPPEPYVLRNGIKLLHKVHANWRAKMMITSLSAQEQAFMRQKVLALTIFKGNKPWNVSRRFDADYLELDSNPHKERYIDAMQNLFATYGDTQIMFADYANKINKIGKCQKRGIVVTEKNIYKHDPKNYKVKKFGIPLLSVSAISLSTKKDTFVVLHVNPPDRDLVLDMGINGVERYSEFVTVLVQEYKKLTGNNLSVKFATRINYNNSRTQEKPGVDSVLVFESSNDVKLKGCQFKVGKSNNTVIYPA